MGLSKLSLFVAVCVILIAVLITVSVISWSIEVNITSQTFILDFVFFVFLTYLHLGYVV